MRRCLEQSVSEAKMCFQILQDEELPWMSRSAGREFLSVVEVMLMRPWGVERVKDFASDMVRWELWVEARCGGRNCGTRDYAVC